MFQSPMQFELEDLKFEWDREKANRNHELHGIRFEEAAEIFLDEESEIIDYGPRKGEVRLVRVGQISGRLVLVVYTERGERIRIISARKPSSHEQRKYRQIRSRS